MNFSKQTLVHFDETRASAPPQRPPPPANVHDMHTAYGVIRGVIDRPAVSRRARCRPRESDTRRSPDGGCLLLLHSCAYTAYDHTSAAPPTTTGTVNVENHSIKPSHLSFISRRTLVYFAVVVSGRIQFSKKKNRSFPCQKCTDFKT